MSSFVRRIQRQQVSTLRSPRFVNGECKGFMLGLPRKKFYQGRGKQLGVTNPKARDLLARLAREKKWGRG